MSKQRAHRRDWRAVVLCSGIALAVACGESADVPSSPSNLPGANPGDLPNGGTSGSGTDTGGGGTGTSGGGSDTGGGSGSGRLSVSLTDSPFSEALAVLVTFSDLSVHRSGGGWESLDFADGGDSMTCDLKQLENASWDDLGSAVLEAGRYTQIRLHVESASIHFDNRASVGPCAAGIAPPAGLTGTVQVPSGTVRLNRTFVVEENGTTSIMLDFDGDGSIRQVGQGSGNGNGGNQGCNNNGNGNPNCQNDDGEEEDLDAGTFIMSPVIRVQSVDEEV